MLIFKVIFEGLYRKTRMTTSIKAMLNKAETEYGLSGNDYRVAKLPKLYLIIIGIIVQWAV